jgi:DNA-binding Lrp family transcriptional regulator
MRRDSRIIRIKDNNSSGTDKDIIRMDNIDMRIIELLTFGYSSKQISGKLEVPLSTIQRRTRHILQRGLLQNNFKPDYKRFGLKKGMIHVYLRDGNIQSTAEKISALEGITSVSIHIGNSDIVADFVYQDSEQIMNIVSSIKKLEGVEKAVWSEEVYALHINQQNLVMPFHRLIGGI